MKESTITIKVKHPPKMPKIEVARLINRLIDAGYEDAMNAPDDWNDPDVGRIKKLQIGDPVIT